MKLAKIIDNTLRIFVRNRGVNGGGGEALILEQYICSDLTDHIHCSSDRWFRCSSASKSADLELPNITERPLSNLLRHESTSQY